MEKKEHGFAGKHYLMKQAFDQEELHRREAVCTREEPPQCSASCPLHLDVRKICGYAAKGDFTRAAAAVRAVTPFLHLLAGSCDESCAKGCILAKEGDGISMRAIEKACAQYGGAGTVNRFLLPRKNKKAAVAGDDLFALACCWELGKKGYEIHWYTNCRDMEEPLLKLGMTKEEAKADLAAFAGLRITRRPAEEWSLSGIKTASGAAEEEDKEKKDEEKEDVACLSPGMEGELPNGAFTAEYGEGAAWILASAKYASLLAERYLQGANAQDVKKPEIYESRLFVTQEGPLVTRAVLKEELATREGAAKEAERCIGCQCLECVKGCVYLQELKRNPRGAIREIYNNLSIVMGNHMANGLINACDECGQCRAACPNDFDYPDVCRIARHTMVDTGKMPPSAHEFALLDQAFSNNEGFLARSQPGFTSCRYLFFPGCQAAAVAPDTVEAAYRDLCARLEGGVALLLGCCGAISDWAAREDLLSEAVNRLLGAWEELGRPEVICACPTCMRTLERYGKLKARGIWEVLMETGVTPVSAETAAIHDACGARGDKKVQDQIRSFAKELGCRIQEIPLERDLAPCCGYGGLVRYANPEMAKKKARFAAGRSPYRLLTYCMACRDQLLREGADSQHILELAYGIEPEPVPDLSGRRANRLRLKQRLLKDIWKEEETMEKKLQIIYESGAEVKMDERMILKSDVEAVLASYEETKEAVEDQEMGWLVANLRLGNVTFWVKFLPLEEGYRVYGAYSHRMTVE